MIERYIGVDKAKDVSLAVNGEPATTAARSLGQLLSERGLENARVATAINGVFVPAGERAATPLAPGDRVEIVSPRQGG